MSTKKRQLLDQGPAMHRPMSGPNLSRDHSELKNVMGLVRMHVRFHITHHIDPLWTYCKTDEAEYALAIILQKKRKSVLRWME